MSVVTQENWDEMENSLILLASTGDWQLILNNFCKNKLLPWIWPTEENLRFIGESAKKFNATGIVSIGCGSGLLEWLIQQVTGIPVKGVEVDKSWWKSKYCKHTFIPLEYTEDFATGYEAARRDDVILFCYFNNEPAFLSYVKQYKGSCLIVIGPGEFRGTHTAPEPFNMPEEVMVTWKIDSMQELGSGKDFIVVFSR